MGSKEYIIVTNNPLVLEKFGDPGNVIYLDTLSVGILKAVRDRVYKGCRLLSHPLAGNFNPGAAPYKSVMISAKGEDMDIDSAKIIEKAISFCGGFKQEPGEYPPEVMNDFQLMDLELLTGAAKSAEY